MKGVGAWFWYAAFNVSSQASSESISKPPVYRIIGIQLVVTVVAGLGGLVLFGTVVAKSVLLGSAIALLPNAYFAWRAFVYNGTRSATKAAGSLLQAEISKLLLTALLFAAVFKLGQPLQPVALFAAYASVLLVGVLASVWLLKPARTERQR